MASKTYNPTSELEAVNLMLTTIGTAPISSLENTGDLNVALAIQYLHEMSREVQTLGYHFNYEEEYPLTLNVSNEAVLPTNTLKATVSPVDAYGNNLVIRGLRMYDRKNHTYSLEKAVKVDITLFLPFEELPQPARQYIAIGAARKFQRRVQGDDSIEKYTGVEEATAKAELEDYEATARRYNLADNDSVFNIIAR